MFRNPIRKAKTLIENIVPQIEIFGGFSFEIVRKKNPIARYSIIGIVRLME